MSVHFQALNPIAHCLLEAPAGRDVVSEGIYRDGDGVRVRFLVPDEYAGHPGIVHGGVTAMLLDEVMGYAVVARKSSHAITQRLRITYIAPIPTNVVHVLEARLDSCEGINGVVTAQVCSPAGEVLVAASGVFRFERDVITNFVPRRVDEVQSQSRDTARISIKP